MIKVGDKSLKLTLSSAETVNQSVRFWRDLAFALSKQARARDLRATTYVVNDGLFGTTTRWEPAPRRKPCASGCSATRGYVFISHGGPWETGRGVLTGEHVLFPSFIQHAEENDALLVFDTLRELGRIPLHVLCGAYLPVDSFLGPCNLRRDNLT
jgi:hypothetical protein